MFLGTTDATDGAYPLNMSRTLMTHPNHRHTNSNHKRITNDNIGSQLPPHHSKLTGRLLSIDCRLLLIAPSKVIPARLDSPRTDVVNANARFQDSMPAPATCRITPVLRTSRMVRHVVINMSSVLHLLDWECNSIILAYF